MSIPEPKVELRLILDEAFEIFGDKSEYVVAAPQYRAAANTAMGWKNSNLRTEMTRLATQSGLHWHKASGGQAAHHPGLPRWEHD